MKMIARAIGQGRLAPGMLEKLEAAMADVWAALDAAWQRLAAEEAATRTAADPATRPADGFRLGGGGGDRSTIALP